MKKLLKGKRFFSGLMATVLLISAMSVSVSAEPVCIEHGPFNYSCAGFNRNETYTHNYNYEGYIKQCTYIHRVWNTNVSCDYCGKITSTGLHSHGYSGHTQYCWYVNSDKCYL